MEKARLTGRTILLVQKDIDSAIPLQDRIVQAGGRVLTGYSLSQALLFANNVRLDGAMIDYEMAGAPEIVSALRDRHVPLIYCSTGRHDGLYTSPGETRTTTIAQSS